MGKLPRRRPSPAMLLALAGLVAAASGEAIADGARAVASVVGKDQVNSRSVKDGSLLLRDVKRSERSKLRGPRGPRGLKGDPGANSLSRLSRKEVALTLPAAQKAACPGTPAGSCFTAVPEFVTGTASCDQGQVAITGGVDSDDLLPLPNPGNTDDDRPEIAESHPTADGTGWIATVANGDTTQPHTATVVVLCTAGVTKP